MTVPVPSAVIGASGFIGHQLWQRYRQTHPQAVGTSFRRPGAGLTQFDLTQPNVAALKLRDTGHQAVVIASARPNIGDCENHPDETRAVNVTGTLALAEQCARFGLSVVFLSSDYVFDGRAGNYADDAPVNPTTEYGRQKAFVERELPHVVDQPLIVRLSKIYGGQRGDRTLLDELAGQLRQGQTIKAARDQVFSPTRVEDVVLAILRLQQLGAVGIMNVAAPEPWSRHAIAVALAEALDADAGLIESISLHDLPGMTNRPLNTSLRADRLAALAPLPFISVADSIAVVAKQWHSQNYPVHGQD